MPAPVYSERFLWGRGSNVDVSLVVPPGRRAVVRFVSIVVFTTVPAYVVVRAHGIPIVWLLAPTADVTKHWDVRAVVYAGESIDVLTQGGDTAWHVAGFLFADE